MVDIASTSGAANERWNLIEQVQMFSDDLIDQVRAQAAEFIARIEEENARRLSESAAFGTESLENHGLDALTDPNIARIIYHCMLNFPIFSTFPTSSLTQAVQAVLGENLPFFNHAYVDSSRGGWDPQDDTLQIRMVIPAGSDEDEIGKAADIILHLWETQLLALPTYGGSAIAGNPSVTVMVSPEYGDGACVVWLKDGVICIPEPMGGGSFTTLKEGLIGAQSRAAELGEKRSLVQEDNAKSGES